MEKNQKTLLQIKLENEARQKEITDREQIKELNRAMIQGQDLNQAAKDIFGPPVDAKPNSENRELKIKNKNQNKFNRTWHE